MEDVARVMVRGPWERGRVRCERVGGGRWQLPGRLKGQVEAEWERQKGVLGRELFDGGLVRLEGMEVEGDELVLRLGETGYKAFFVLHMARLEWLPEAAEERPNPVGVSVAVISAEGKLVMGRRGSRVAYYPGRVHPFAGSMEPGDGCVFEAARREMLEEIGVGEVVSERVLAVVEDPALRHPEVVVEVRVSVGVEEIRARVDAREHEGIWVVGESEDGMTPVGRAVVGLVG